MSGIGISPPQALHSKPQAATTMQQPFANPLPPDNARRFGGIARLYGAAGAQALAQAHVAVVGIGGVGSWAAEALARSGVGRITLVDMDHVAESNINRQLHATDRTLGQAKAQAMRERIASYHPACQVSTVDDFVEPDNWPALLPAPVDAVIDACDQMRAKAAMAAWARHTATPFKKLLLRKMPAGIFHQPDCVCRDTININGIHICTIVIKCRFLIGNLNTKYS